MKNLNIEKLEVKKNKVILTVSVDIGSHSNIKAEEAFKNLLALGVVSGGSANSIRAVSDGNFNNDLDFGLFHMLKGEMYELVNDGVTEIERVEKFSNINYKSITFK